MLDGDGDGTPGGDFRYELRVLQGDVDQGGSVLANDFSEVKQKFFSTAASPGSGAGGYSVFHDVDGSGDILAADFSAVKRRFFTQLPPPPTASEWFPRARPADARRVAAGILIVGVG